MLILLLIEGRIEPFYQVSIEFGNEVGNRLLNLSHNE